MNIAIKTKDVAIFTVVSIFAFFANIAPTLASEITSQKMIELTNTSRVEAGLGTLVADGKLAQAAQAKANDMFAKQYFEHTSPEGLTPWHWFDLADYEYVYAAENLAIDFITAEGAHSALMKSAGHRENILGRNYEEIGIAVASGTFEGRETTIIVEEFGSEREPKVTVNNLPFFERAEVVRTTVQVAEENRTDVVPQISMTAEKEVAEVTADVSEPVVADTDSVHEMILDEVKQSEMVVEKTMVTAEEGKSISKVYSVRRMGELKKVYAEDIYWEHAEGDGIIASLSDRTMQIRLFLLELTSDIMLPLFQG